MDQLKILVVHDGETCNYTSLYEEVNAPPQERGYPGEIPMSFSRAVLIDSHALP
jgi:hypothetical protein